MSNPLEDLLSGVLGGGSGGSAGGSNPLDFIGNLLGGAAPQGGDQLGGLGNLLGGTAPQGGDQLGGLANLLGGAMPQGTNQTGGVGNLLQMITTGGGTNATSNQVLGPLVGSLGSKLNLSPDIAEQVISFATHHLVSGHLSGPSNSSHADLMSQITSGKVTKDFLNQSGLSQQLAQQASIDPKVATDSLKHVLEQFGQHMK